MPTAFKELKNNGNGTENNQLPLMGPWVLPPRPRMGLSLSPFKIFLVGSAAPHCAPVGCLVGLSSGPPPLSTSALSNLRLDCPVHSWHYPYSQPWQLLTAPHGLDRPQTAVALHYCLACHPAQPPASAPLHRTSVGSVLLQPLALSSWPPCHMPPSYCALQ